MRGRRLLVLTVIAFILLAGLVIGLKWNEVRSVVGAAKWYVLAAALFFTLLSYVVLSQGYVVLNRLFGVLVPWRDLFEIGILSTTLNSILAFSGAVGHSLRMAFVKGPGATTGGVFAASIFHSYLNYVMMLLMMAVGIGWLLIVHDFPTGGAISLGILTALLISTSAASTFIVFVKPWREWVVRLLGKIWHFFTRRNPAGFARDFNEAMDVGIKALGGHTRTLAWLLALMASYWAFAAVALWFCFFSFGDAPGAAVLLAGFGIGITAGNLSMVPGGLAVQEASMSGVYALLGVPFAKAVLAAILFRAVYDFIPFFISLALYGRLMRGQADRKHG